MHRHPSIWALPNPSVFSISLLLATVASPALAIDRDWTGGFNASWETATNWTPLGVPTSADRAIVASGSAELSTNQAVDALLMSGGSIFGTGMLTVTGLSTLSAGFQTGTGTSQFDGNVTMLGASSRVLGGGRTMNTTATTSWGGNAAASTNRIDINGSATINNSGTWTDSNAADTSIGSGSGGTKVFNNSGTYNKSGAGTTHLFVSFNNTGTTDIQTGTLSLRNGGLLAGSVDIAPGATLAVGRNGSSAGLVTFDNALALSGTGELLIDANGSGAVDALFDGNHSHAGATRLVSGTAQVDDTLALASFEQTGGILTGGGTVTVTGPATLAAGFQTGTGTSQFDGNVAMLGASSRALGGGRTMNTTATTSWGGNAAASTNRIDINGSATINNSGTWTDSNAADTSIGSGSGGTKVFNNSGTYNKSGAGTTHLFVSFNNTGTTDIQTGTLSLRNGGLLAGSVDIAPGATLAVGRNGSSAGLVTFDNALALSGTGELLIDANGSGAVDALFDGNHSHAGATRLVSGTAQVDDTLALASFEQTGGILTGGGTVTVTGPATLAAGFQTGTGTSQFDDNVAMLGASSRALGGGRTMNTTATTSWGGNAAASTNRIDINGSATINNSGTWTDSNAADTSIGSGSGGTKVFNNSGTYNKSGAGTTHLFVSFNNTGTTDIQTGTLSLRNGGLLAGSVDIAPGATLAVGRNGSSAGLVTFDNALALSGTGELLIDANGSGAVDALFDGNHSHAGATRLVSGTAQVDDTLALASFEQTGGILTGGGTVTVTGPVTLAAGFQTGTGTSQFDDNVAMLGASSRALGGGRTMNTTATTSWGGNAAASTNRIDINGSATINNSGTWTDSNAADTSIGSGSGGTKVFNNSGTYNKSGNSRTRLFAAYSNGGTTTVHDGRLDFEGALTNTGTLAGNGTIETPSAGFLNDGEIAPGVAGVGALSFDGDLSLASSSMLSFELASSGSFDQLFVSGDATIGGNISILGIGGFAPAIGDEFVVMTFADSIGDQVFGSVNWSGFSPNIGFGVIYNPDNITLAVAAIPEPSQYAMMLAGLGVLATIARRRRPRNMAG